ncbi:MAG: hypothetical protein V4717_14140 [Bacteroidota bacterium]
MIFTRIKIYFLLLMIAATIIFLPKGFHRFFWSISEGKYIGSLQERYGRNSKVNYPLIEFETGKKPVRFLAPQYLRDFMTMNQKVTVLHSAINPENAFVLDYYGLWGVSFIYFGIFLLVLTPLTFGGSFFPKMFKVGFNSNRGVIIRSV